MHPALLPYYYSSPIRERVLSLLVHPKVDQSVMSLLQSNKCDLQGMEGGIIDTLLLTIHHLVDARSIDARTRMESDIWHITAHREWHRLWWLFFQLCSLHL